MAVQKSRRTRSTRGMRRSHDGLTSSALSIDQETGETHRRHHVTDSGYYRGKQVLSSANFEDKELDNKNIVTISISESTSSK